MIRLYVEQEAKKENQIFHYSMKKSFFAKR